MTQIKVYVGDDTEAKWDRICEGFTSNTAAFAVIVENYYNQMEGEMNIENQYAIGDEIQICNPRTGELETGKVTAYAKDQTQQTRRATGLMVKFDGQAPVEIDGEFLV